ncbi:MAG: hypothetical protein KC519_09505, partial [Anaerolineae bacterium]|nr:hypothetical protein [Anaerolineae bacterium]
MLRRAFAAIVAILTCSGGVFADDWQLVKDFDGLTAADSTTTPDSGSRYRLGQFYVRNAPDGQTLLIEEIIGPPPVVEIMVMSGNREFKQVPVEVGDRIASIDATRGLSVEKLAGILNEVCAHRDGSFDMTVLRQNPRNNQKIVNVGSNINCDAKPTSADRFTKKDGPTRKVDPATEADPTKKAESATWKDSPFTGQQVAEDIEQLYGNLVTFHPHLYRHISPKAFKDLKAKLIADLPEKVSSLRAYAALQRLAAAVCDSHTFVTPETKIVVSAQREWPWADWQLAVAKGKLFAESGDTHFYQKHEIHSINGVSGTEIADNILAHVSYDGCIGERTRWLSGHRQSQLIFTSLFEPQ